MKEKKVAIVDDDPMILDLYARKFKEKGYDVLAMNDRTVTLEQLRSFAAPVVLLDISMPTKNGLDMLQEIKNTFRGDAMPYVILLTNNDEVSLKTKGEELGARDYIVKASKTPSEVFALVESALETM